MRCHPPTTAFLCALSQVPLPGIEPGPRPSHGRMRVSSTPQGHDTPPRRRTWPHQYRRLCRASQTPAGLRDAYISRVSVWLRDNACHVPFPLRPHTAVRGIARHRAVVAPICFPETHSHLVLAYRQETTDKTHTARRTGNTAISINVVIPCDVGHVTPQGTRSSRRH